MLTPHSGRSISSLTRKNHRTSHPWLCEPKREVSLRAYFLKGSDRIDNTYTIQLTEIQYAALLDRAAELEISLEDFILQAIQNQIKEVDPHA